MSGIQCKCGRFLARPRATSKWIGEGYSAAEVLSEIRGDCSRCDPDSPAMPGGWWWDADYWKWPDD